MNEASHHLEIFGLYCAAAAVFATGLFMHIGFLLDLGWVGIPAAAAASAAGAVVIHHTAGWYARRHQLDQEEVADR